MLRKELFHVCLAVFVGQVFAPVNGGDEVHRAKHRGQRGRIAKAEEADELCRCRSWVSECRTMVSCGQRKLR